MDAIVCGIDPGLGATGYGVLRIGDGAIVVVDAGVCRQDPKRPLAQRLQTLGRDVAAILDEFKPVVVAVEELYSHYNHPRTAVLMGHARGVILSTVADRRIDVRGYSATRIKKHLTGNGRAAKEQVQAAVREALGLTDLPEPPDLADALAIALCCAGEIMHRPLQEAVR